MVAMFVDELTITAIAGNGGDGVVRWRQEKFKPKGGPAGGNGGRGGDVYLHAVADSNRLSRYRGNLEFRAQHGAEGRSLSQHGSDAEDLYIDIPVGSKVTDIDRGYTYTFTAAGESIRVLRGGSGGLGNEYFKSSTNRSPMQSTKGKVGERGNFHIEVALVVDVGLIGLPNAGKSSLLSALTNATPEVGSYPFTTLEPHLGTLGNITIADIPGLIEGAAQGKGLGHKFLRHITRTKRLLHLVSLESEDPKKDYYTIRDELSAYDKSLSDIPEWIVLSKKDIVDEEYIAHVKKEFDKINNDVFVLSILDDESVATVADALRSRLHD